MTNLLQICEDIKGEEENEDGANEEDMEEEEDISSSSPEEASHSTPRIENEVRATMAVGAQLNINFPPNHVSILRKMVRIELRESELLRRSEWGN